MTQEQKTAVQKAALAAARSVEQRDTPIATAVERSSVAKWFKAGAQTILENPVEWGLFTESEILESQKSLAEAYGFHNKKFNSALIEARCEAAKYREALEHLERFTSDNPDYEFINHRLKEALKQNEQ